MHPQLEILLQLQDLKSQRRELSETAETREVESQEFQLDVDQAVKDLELKIGELEGDLTPQIRGRYERIKAARPRVVVPVLNGTCYGCFVSIPTAHDDASANKDVRTCENCGRFLYVPA
jgi:predicted  nucleic acid-binding Zn-ribbon protein